MSQDHYYIPSHSFFRMDHVQESKEKKKISMTESQSKMNTPRPVDFKEQQDTKMGGNESHVKKSEVNGMMTRSKLKQLMMIENQSGDRSGGFSSGVMNTSIVDMLTSSWVGYAYSLLPSRTEKVMNILKSHRLPTSSTLSASVSPSKSKSKKKSSSS